MLRVASWAGIAALVLLGGASSGDADLLLSLSSTGPGLDNLLVGQTVTFQLELSNLEPAQQLDSLAATVIWDEALLGEPTISVGAVVPDPLHDPIDVLMSEGPGEADVTFWTEGTESAHHIVTHGAFFSFDTTVLAAGSGSLDFSWVDATEYNPLDPFDPIQLYPETGPPLGFTVVPEPSTLLLMLCAGVFVGWAARSLRRRSSSTHDAGQTSRPKKAIQTVPSRIRTEITMARPKGLSNGNEAEMATLATEEESFW